MIFFVLLVLTRLAGKKQLSQSTYFDFITAIAVGDLVAENLADPEKPVLPWLAGTVLWFALTIALDLTVLKNRPIAKLMEGEPSVVIENGRILEKNLARNFLRVDDLLARLRAQGHFNPSDVEFAIFETDGTVSVLAKSQARPVTPRDLGLFTEYEGVTRELVMEGRVIQSNLKAINLSEEWLRAELLRLGYDDLQQVFYAAVDSQGKLFVDGYCDRISGSRVQIADKGPH